MEEEGNGRIELDGRSVRGPVSFPRIWFQTTTPCRSRRAYEARVTGELFVDPDEGQVLFKPNPGGTFVLSKIVDVQMGCRGTDLANVWIEEPTQRWICRRRSST